MNIRLPDWSTLKSFVTDKAWPFVDDFIDEFVEDDVLGMAGGLAYYTVFALPPIMLLFMTVAGFLYDPGQVDEMMRTQLERLIGVAGAEELLETASRIHHDEDRGLWSLFGLGALFFGATAAFAQLQLAMNRAWDVRVAPERNPIWDFLTKRLVSFAMMTSFALLLTIGLVTNAVLSGLGDRIAEFLGISFHSGIYAALYTTVDLLLIVCIIAAVFKVLPDAKVAWRDVFFGALITGVMFTLGRWGIGAFLGSSRAASAYGAAASLVIVMIWTYYSAIIVLGGAELTQLIVQYRGKTIEPDENAVRVVEKIQDISEEKDAS